MVAVIRGLAVLAVALLGGCWASYRAAVETYASTLHLRGKIYYSKVEPELRKELVLNDAALVCLVDQDAKRGGTAACRCADRMPESWEKNCSDWLR